MIAAKVIGVAVAVWVLGGCSSGESEDRPPGISLPADAQQEPSSGGGSGGNPATDSGPEGGGDGGEGGAIQEAGADVSAEDGNGLDVSAEDGDGQDVGVEDTSVEPETGPTPEDFPPAVEVEQSTVEIGFWDLGHMGTAEVEAFRISQTPTTVAQYRRCVDAGGCTPPTWNKVDCTLEGRDDWLGATYLVEGGDDLPVTCLAPAQARTFCQWLGGELPSLSKWLLAARGPDIHKYSWGDSNSGFCAKHPGSSRMLEWNDCCPDSHCSQADFEVNLHPQGASPLGVEDVKLTTQELLAVGPSDARSPCYPPDEFCAVRGYPAQIDGLDDVFTTEPDLPGVVLFTFRCTWRN